MTNKLSNIEIFEISDKMRLPLEGIFFKDDLPNPLKKGFYIINLQSEMTNGRGTHWTAFYYDGIKNIYYDSFGFPAPKETEAHINPYIYSKKNIQDINTSSCGFYCLAFIKFLKNKINKEKAFNTFINLFDDKTYKNEMILDSILYDKEYKTYMYK